MRQLRVRVKKHKPLPSRDGCASVHLTRAPARGGDADDVDAWMHALKGYPNVLLRRRDDDDACAGKISRSERPCQRGRVAIDGNDDGGRDWQFEDLRILRI